MPDRRMQRMSPKQYIDSLPRGGIECGICYDAFDEGPARETGVVLTCGHVFGEGCLGKWFEMEKRPYGSCPLCRRRLFKHTPARRIRQLNWKMVLVVSIFLWLVDVEMRLILAAMGLARAWPGWDFAAIPFLIMVKEYVYPSML